MTVQSRIEDNADASISRPSGLIVINESHLHAGHQPDITGAGETHMRVRIVSAKFAGMSPARPPPAITHC